MLYAFGDYTLDPARYELRRAGVLVLMEPRAFDLLAYLVQHAGQTVSKEELFAQLWAEQFVTDSALTYCVTGVRKAIGDSGRGQRYIRTVHGRGYRFIVPEAPQPPPPTAVPSLAQADTAVSLPAVLPAPPAALSAAPEPTRSPYAGAPALAAAEWRQLTVLACHLVYGTAPTPLDAEVRLAVVRDYRQRCTDVLHRFGGALPQYHGLGLVAYFGYPQAQEDAARRAVFAGLGLVEEVAILSRRVQRDWGVSLAVQVGMHTGREVVGSLAPGDRGAPLALGDTQTLATALRDSAPLGTVLLSQATFRLVESDVACAALGTHLLEERADPLVVYQVLHASSPQQRRDVTRPQGLTPFVGREPEVGLLHEAWTQAAEGLGQAVVLRGEAGIGKSRLMQVFTAQLTEAVYTRLECHCSPYSQHTAFYPVVSALQQFLHFRPEDTAAAQLHHVAGLLERAGLAVDEQMSLWAALLALPLPAHYPPCRLSPQLQRQQTLEALITWLRKEAERQPVCVIVEDLHWADASTLEWLTLLLDQVPTAQARALCQQVGEPPELVPVLYGLWRCYSPRSQLHTARELGDTLLRLAQQAHDPALAVLAHYALGSTWFSFGALSAARQHLEAGIARYTPEQRRAPAFRMGHDPGVACRIFAAMTLWLLGYPQQALARIQEALALAHELAHPYSLGWAWVGAAVVYQCCRDVPAVREQAEAAVTLSTAQGFPLWEAAGRSIRGWALARQGQGEEGIAQSRQGLAAWQATGSALAVPYHCTVLADIAAHLGHLEEGLQALAEAHALLAPIYAWFTEGLDTADLQDAQALLAQLQG